MADGKAIPSRVIGSVDYVRPKPPVQDEKAAEALKIVSGTKCAMPFIIKYVVPEGRDENEINSEVNRIVNELFETVKNTFSIYEEKSEINRFNAIKANEKFEMSQEFKEVILVADEIVRKTKGYFDPAIAPLYKHYSSTAKQSADVYQKKHISKQESLEIEAIQKWKSLLYRGFGTTSSDGRLSRVLEKMRIFSSWNMYEISECRRYLIKFHDDAKLGLDAISKGWAVDTLSRRLKEELHLKSLYVDWAGDIKVVGQHPSGRKWKVAVPEPPGIEEISKEVEEIVSSNDWNHSNIFSLKTAEFNDSKPYLDFIDLEDGQAVATSGDYERAIIHENLAYSHVINPKTATLKQLDETSLAQTTVISSSCMVADALATAALSRGDPHDARTILDTFRTGYVEPVANFLLYCRGGPRIIRMSIPGIETKEQRQQRMADHNQATVIVVGGGLAGLSASIQAADVGAKVILIEKEKRTGGNSAKATSGINGWGTKTQARLRVADEERYFERDTFRSGKGGKTSECLIRTLSTKSADAIEWLYGRFGVPLTVLSQLGGHSVKRTHRAPPDEKGNPVPIGYVIMKTLQAAIERDYKDKIELWTNTRVTKLKHSDAENGYKTVHGVYYTSESNSEQYLEADAVILTTGGFGYDRGKNSLLAKYRPDLLEIASTNGPHAVGDGVNLGLSVGANVVDMDKVQLHPTGFIDPKDPFNNTKFLAPEAIRGSGAILVNSEGTRFVNELDLRSVVASAIMKHGSRYDNTGPPFAWCILDSKGQELFGIPTLNFYKDRLGLWEKCDSIEACAEILGCSSKTLNTTVQEYHEAVQKGVCEKTGKMVFPADFSPEANDFMIARVTPVIHYTMGGLDINAATEVQEIIPGRVVGSHRHIRRLFAAGEVTGGLHGSNRLGGNSLLECTVFGRIAGERAAMIKNPYPYAFSEDKWIACEMREMRNTDKYYGKNTREIRFNLHGSLQKTGLAIGQCITIKGELDGETLQGYFSPITRPDDEGVIGILCRFDQKGGPIYSLLDYIRSGSIVYIKPAGGPKLKTSDSGIFYNGRQIKKIGLLAGGTGIAPMIQIIREYIHFASKNPDKTKPLGANLLYAAEEEADLAYMQTLDYLQEYYPNDFRFYPILNQPPLGWPNGVGYIKPKNIRQKIFYPPEDDQLMIICGPPVFERAMCKTLRALGFKEECFYAYSQG